MNQFICASVFVLVVCFVIILLSGFIKRKTDTIFYKVDALPAQIEGEIRSILMNNPSCDITIYNLSKNEESRRIIEILSEDFPQITIKE